MRCTERDPRSHAPRSAQLLLMHGWPIGRHRCSSRPALRVRVVLPSKHTETRRDNSKATPRRRKGLLCGQTLPLHYPYIELQCKGSPTQYCVQQTQRHHTPLCPSSIEQPTSTNLGLYVFLTTTRNEGVFVPFP
eukprot:52809-Eustigmatos_ZCMA.PRE.1